MDADAEAEREGQEEQQARVAGAAPTEHEPHIERAEEHGHGVDLALDGREPGGVGEEVAECGDGGRQLACAEFACGAEEHHDCEGGAECAEGVAEGCHPEGVAAGQEHGAVGQELVEGRSRRVAHLQGVAGDDELAAVPPGDGGVEGEEVDGGGEERQEPSRGAFVAEEGYQLTTALLKMSSHSSVTISPTRVLSTAERSREAA